LRYGESSVLARVGRMFALTATAYNLVRLFKQVAALEQNLSNQGSLAKPTPKARTVTIF
jgi:hypothetical protein